MQRKGERIGEKRDTLSPRELCCTDIRIREYAAANGSLLLYLSFLLLYKTRGRVRTELKRGSRGEGPLATPRSHARAPCKFSERQRDGGGERKRKKDYRSADLVTKRGTSNFEEILGIVSRRCLVARVYIYTRLNAKRDALAVPISEEKFRKTASGVFVPWIS